MCSAMKVVVFRAWQECARSSAPLCVYYCTVSTKAKKKVYISMEQCIIIKFLTKESCKSATA